MLTVKEFSHGWKHFLDCIDFDPSYLDAEAKKFINEAPAEIIRALAFVDKMFEIDHEVYETIDLT